IDSLHFQRAGQAPADLKSVDRNLLNYSQICDGQLHCENNMDVYLTDAVDLRSAPGEGELPLASLLEALPPAIPLSLEVRSKAYRDRYSDATDRAAAVRQQSLAYFNDIGISIRSQLCALYIAAHLRRFIVY